MKFSETHRELLSCNWLTVRGRNPAAIRVGILGKAVRKGIDASSTARRLGYRPVDTRLNSQADRLLSPDAREKQAKPVVQVASGNGEPPRFLVGGLPTPLESVGEAQKRMAEITEKKKTGGFHPPNGYWPRRSWRF